MVSRTVAWQKLVTVVNIDNFHITSYYFLHFLLRKPRASYCQYLITPIFSVYLDYCV